jgi:hypothetical protein
VNRAGLLLLDLREQMRRDGAERADSDSDEKQLEQAWAALTWWRGLRARPLSTIAANLRYHVDRGDARVRRRIEVTQRLKRLETLIGKLGRERYADAGRRRCSRGASQPAARLRRSTSPVEVLDGHRGARLHRDAQEQRVSSAAPDCAARGIPDRGSAADDWAAIWANTVEQVGRELGVDLKTEISDERLEPLFLTLAELIARFDRGELSPDELRAALRRLPSLTAQTPREEAAQMSPADDIKHFLVTRDVARGKTIVVEFGTDYEAAQRGYQAAEQEARGRPDLDVVLLGADSLETIKRTHSSYFEAKPLDELLPA